MKVVKKALLGMSVAGVLVVSAGLGTYSWFTSETSAVGKVENGTLEINAGQDITTPLFAAEKFAPSQLKFGDAVTIENTGNLATHLKAILTQSVDKASLQGYKIGFIAMKYKVTPNADEFLSAQMKLEKLYSGVTNAINNNTEFVTFNKTSEVETVGGIIGEDQMQAMSTNFGKTSQIILADSGKEGEENAFWKLEEDEKIDIMFGIKLSASAGNEYQGAKYTANLKVKAKQTDEGAKYAE